MSVRDVARATEASATAWIREGRRFVQALLVSVEGSAPLPAGAMMLVGVDGEIEGSITGGCVESELVEQSEAILAGRGRAGVFSYGISDEMAGAVGLMCGGIVDIFLHELDDAAAAAELRVLTAHGEDEPAAVATLLDGPTAGARLSLVGGATAGSLGRGDLLDRNVAREAAGVLAEGRTTLRRFGADGATLGDELRVHIRAYAPRPRMIIFGAIDFSAALAPMATSVGFEVTICDARPRFAGSRRFSADAEVLVGWPQDLMRDVSLQSRDAVLVFTHDPRFDEPALIAALATDAGYIGAMGSRRTAADRERRLLAAGVDPRQLERIRAPCGLDIGSRTAEETAVSVLAEIIAARARRSARPLRATRGPIHSRAETPS